jgi:integrase
MLTDTKLRALKRRQALYRVADANGLCIEVPTSASGTRLWRFRYRFNGKASMLALGKYPDVSLLEARALRDDARKLLKAGTNPADAARAAKAVRADYAANTFGAIAAELIDKREREGLSAGTIYRERQWLKNDLAPHLGTLPIKDVTAPLLLATLRRIESRAVETAHRARGLCVQVFRYAVATGRAERNIAEDTRGALTAPKTGHFASITEPAQVAPLLRAMWGYQGTPAVNAALKLAPLLFVRPGELRSMRWSDVELDAAQWRYTTSKTKTQHIVPLASQAVTILRELHPFTERSEYVFPSARGAGRPMSENAVNVALRTMGYNGETITGHGFRAMARTILDEVLHVRPDFIEHQLAHAVKDPNGRAYNRTAHLAERREMMQAWANYLDQLRAGQGKVVPIRRTSSGRQAKP